MYLKITKMNNYVPALLSGFNTINGRGDKLYEELTKALLEGISHLYYGSFSPLGPPDFGGSYFLHLSLPLATGVGCQSPIFSPHPPITLDMTDSQLGLPNSQTQHTLPCNREKYSLPFSGTVTHTALSTASELRLFLFSCH